MGTKVDVPRALDLFQRAHEQGDAGGSCGLAYMHSCGLGVPRNMDRAIELYTLAADAGVCF